MQNYSIKTFRKSVPVAELKAKSHIDPDRIVKFCQACPMYNSKWSCPPFEFSVEDYWDKYTFLNLIAVKIDYSDKLRNLPVEEQTEWGKLIIEREKLRILDELYKIEQEIPGARVLSAGTCDFCKLEGGCSRPSGKPCRHPKQMRYSIESLGGDLVSILDEYFDESFKWTADGSLPEYHIIIFGILEK